MIRAQHTKEGYYVDQSNKFFPIHSMNDKKIREALKDLRSRVDVESNKAIIDTIAELMNEQIKRKESNQFMKRLERL